MAEGRRVKRMATKTQVISRPPKPNTCPKKVSLSTLWNGFTSQLDDDGRRCIVLYLVYRRFEMCGVNGKSFRNAHIAFTHFFGNDTDIKACIASYGDSRCHP